MAFDAGLRTLRVSVSEGLAHGPFAHGPFTMRSPITQVCSNAVSNL